MIGRTDKTHKKKKEKKKKRKKKKYEVSLITVHLIWHGTAWHISMLDRSLSFTDFETKIINFCRWIFIFSWAPCFIWTQFKPGICTWMIRTSSSPRPGCWHGTILVGYSISSIPTKSNSTSNVFPDLLLQASALWYF
jgi:hypothetical protein